MFACRLRMRSMRTAAGVVTTLTPNLGGKIDRSYHDGLDSLVMSGWVRCKGSRGPVGWYPLGPGRSHCLVLLHVLWCISFSVQFSSQPAFDGRNRMNLRRLIVTTAIVVVS